MTRLQPHAVLASFPRSGRTWLAGMVSAAELQKLRRQTSTPIRAFVNSLDESIVSEWQAAFGSLVQPPLRLATHGHFEPDIHRQNLVLLVRSPADSLWSYFHYRSSHRSDFSGSLDDFLSDRHSGIAGVARWYNSWAGVRSQSVVITYEELRSNPGTHLRRALDGLDCSTTMDAEVVAERWAFERRQENEIRNLGGSASTNGLFIRSGSIGEGSRSFDPAQQARLTRELRKLLEPAAASWMESLGYLSR